MPHIVHLLAYTNWNCKRRSKKCELRQEYKKCFMSPEQLHSTMPDEWLHVGTTVQACYLPFKMQSNGVDFTENKDILFRLQSLHSHLVTQTSWGCTGPNDLTCTSKGSYSLHRDETLDSAKSTNMTDSLPAGVLTLFPDQKHVLFLAFPAKGSKQRVCLSLCPSVTDFQTFNITEFH
jgi:hypothetical protein